MRTERRMRWLLGVLVTIVVGTGVGFSVAQTSTSRIAAPDSIGEIAQGVPSSQTADGVAHIVDPSLLVDAGPERDGIPPIDAPQFESVESADAWLQDEDWVLVAEYAGIQRAYPLQILVWHEIVNDVIAGEPVLVTYCPLCASSAVYHRTLDGQTLGFGTSGKLYNSNLVMYDRATETYWSQLEGLALVGALAGQQLVRMTSDTVRWGDWKASMPEAEVLSRNTGFDRDYAENPYAEYLEDSAVCFPLSDRSNCIPPKTLVLGVQLENAYIAIEEDTLIARGSVELRIEGQRILFSRLRSGAVRVANLGTGEPLTAVRAFWFAWYAFHPETQLSDGSSS